MRGGAGGDHESIHPHVRGPGGAGQANLMRHGSDPPSFMTRQLVYKATQISQGGASLLALLPSLRRPTERGDGTARRHRSVRTRCPTQYSTQQLSQSTTNPTSSDCRARLSGLVLSPLQGRRYYYTVSMSALYIDTTVTRLFH